MSPEFCKGVLRDLIDSCGCDVEFLRNDSVRKLLSVETVLHGQHFLLRRSENS